MQGIFQISPVTAGNVIQIRVSAEVLAEGGSALCVVQGDSCPVTAGNVLQLQVRVMLTALRATLQKCLQSNTAHMRHTAVSTSHKHGAVGTPPCC